jgi:hypothetical protein
VCREVRRRKRRVVVVLLTLWVKCGKVFGTCKHLLSADVSTSGHCMSVKGGEGDLIKVHQPATADMCSKGARVGCGWYAR